MGVAIVRNAALADLEDIELREKLERTHAALLREHGMDHLNIVGAQPLRAR